MIRYYIIFLMFIFANCSSVMGSNDPKQLFSQANKEYINGNYKKALELYKSTLKSYGAPPELLYNIGNAYYKNGEIGKAILFLERAQWLEPGNADVKKNLEAIRKNTGLMSIEPSLFDNYMSRFTLNEWLIIITIIVAVFAILMAVRAISPQFFNQRTFRNITIFASVLLAIAICGIINQSLELERAIVINDGATVRISPFDAAEQTATLKTGRDVYIVKQYGDYYSIKDKSGTTGWVNKKQVAKIIPEV